MKRRALAIAGLVLLVASGAAYVGFRDLLPPTTPQIRARRISALSIPRSAEVLSYTRDVGHLGRESYTMIRLRVDSVAFERVAAEAQAKEYRSLRTTTGEGLSTLQGLFGPDAAGWYRVERFNDGVGFRLIVVDARTKTVIVEWVQN